MCKARLVTHTAAARRQGKASFGDAGVFVEKYVQRARHIEVQIFGDGAGAIVTLPERECSVQRRHQKVVEETPSPYVPSERAPSPRIPLQDGLVAPCCCCPDAAQVTAMHQAGDSNGACEANAQLVRH